MEAGRGVFRLILFGSALENQCDSLFPILLSVPQSLSSLSHGQLSVEVCLNKCEVDITFVYSELLCTRVIKHVSSSLTLTFPISL